MRTPLGPLTLPVSLYLNGSTSPAAALNAQFGRFLDHTLNIGLPFSSSALAANGPISTAGAFAQTFNGPVTW